MADDWRKHARPLLQEWLNDAPELHPVFRSLGLDDEPMSLADSRAKPDVLTTLQQLGFAPLATETLSISADVYEVEVWRDEKHEVVCDLSLTEERIHFSVLLSDGRVVIIHPEGALPTKPPSERRVDLTTTGSIAGDVARIREESAKPGRVPLVIDDIETRRLYRQYYYRFIAADPSELSKANRSEIYDAIFRPTMLWKMKLGLALIVGGPLALSLLVIAYFTQWSAFALVPLALVVAFFARWLASEWGLRHKQHEEIREATLRQMESGRLDDES